MDPTPVQSPVSAGDSALSTQEQAKDEEATLEPLEPQHSRSRDIESRSSESSAPTGGLADVEKRPTAWICVLGAFFFLMPTYGFMQSVGTVQAHIQQHQLSGYSSRDVGWITGMYTFLSLFLGIQTGPLMDAYGTPVLAPLAACLVAPMFFLLAECTLYWHFMLCLGLLGGVGGALACTVAVSAVSKLFVRYRGLAVGIAMAGSSIGGLVFPMMLRAVMETRGYTRALRAVGFVAAGLMVVGVVCLVPYPRLLDRKENGAGHGYGDVESSREGPPSETETTRRMTRREKRRGAALNFAAFRTPSFSFVTASVFLLEFAIFGVSGMLPTVVAWSGFPAETGYNFIAIMNSASFFGRVLPGLVGDRLGHLNVLLVMLVITVLSTAVTLVPFGSSYIAALYVFAVTWGLGSGSFLSLTPVCVGKTCEAKDYGRYFGTMNFCISFAALITLPIGGQMLETMGATALSGLYLAVVFLGGVSSFAARSLLVGSWFDFAAKI